MTSAQVSIPQLKGRDFLKLSDYSSDEIQSLLDFALQLKAEKRSGKAHPILQGKSIAMYFEKPSNRTRLSFDAGIYDLGAHPIMLRKDEINLGVRETIADTARTFSRYVQGIMIRTFAQSDVMELARHATVPVINGLTDDHHPCQVMADLLTVYEHFKTLKGLKLTYIGDGNNMANSLMEGCALVGMDIAIASPSNYQPNPLVVEEARKMAAKTGAKIEITESVQLAVRDASVLYTDVWASMGQESEAETRRIVFKDYQVNDALLAQAKPGAIVLHCLPAHRGEEITAEVMDSMAPIIFEQTENRLHAQKAIMAALIAD